MKFLIIFIIIFDYTNSIYFLVHKGVKKCFYEEFYKDTIVSLRFATLDDIHEEGEHEHSPVFDFIITNLDTKIELDTLQGMSLRGKVNFIVSESAPYSICAVAREDSQMFLHRNMVKLSVILEPIDESTEEKDLSEVPKSKDLEHLSRKVDKIYRKIVDIMKTQNYQINKEDEFSHKQIENSSIIVYVTVLQILILLIMTLWQIYSFKNFFKDKISFMI